MSHETLLALAILVPTLGSFLLIPAGLAAGRLRNALALLFILTAFVCSAVLLPTVLTGAPVTIKFGSVGGLDLSLTADRLAVFMAMVSSLISAIIVIYSFDYISHYKNNNEYYFMVVLFLGSMMGLVYASNLIVLYVFWELTGLASWRLIGFFREDFQVYRANKAFLVTIFGALAMLLGFIMLGTQAGSFNMDAIKQHFGATPVTGMAVGLIMMGILSKSATLPFHTWLPDAGVAPSPVTSLLHAAVLVKIGVYVFARLFIATVILSVSWQHGVMVIAAASALVSACAALVETDLKRIIAYSTVSQIAFIFLGLASGTQIGVVGGLLYILMHGLAKGGLFLCAGIVEQKTHTKDIMKLGGLIKTMPYTAIAFLLCALSVMGIPPFGGFFSKLMVLTGAVEAKETGGPWMAAVFVFGAVLTILYLIRVFNRVFLGEAHTEPVKEGSPVMVTCVWTLAVLGLIAGLYVNPSMQVARAAFEQMTGVVK
jgi:NADH:ubiquinone oxidoreductase subunit 5 (subunit L)/multisubunit Na+/H+ antiporter MnhA subunit